MRFVRLGLAKFGHLTNVALDFSAPAPVHVVLGANEAGKSTALAAIGDALFGFPPRSPHNYIHDYPDLRIDIEVEAGGRTRSFTRLKRNKNDLLDGAGQPAAETALHGLATRSMFEHLFGLSGATLRQGGQDILAGKGDVGTMLFQASSGLQGVPAAAQRLRDEAARLYPARKDELTFHAATRRHQAAKDDLGQRTVGADAHDRAGQTVERLQQSIEADRTTSGRLTAERKRWERAARVAGPLHERADAWRLLAELGEVACLPADATERREAAVRHRQVGADAHDRAVDALRGLTERLALATPDENVLREAAAIMWLAENLSRAEAARHEREDVARAADDRRRTIERHALSLQLTGSAAEIVARIPGKLERQAVRRMALEHAKLSERHRGALLAHAEADRRATAAVHAEPASAPKDPAPLRRAIDTARAEGPIDKEYDAAKIDHKRARIEVQRALASLPGWTGDAPALAATPVPLAPALRVAADAVGSAKRDLHDAERDLAASANGLAAAQARRNALEMEGKLPTADAVDTLRRRRDRVWQLVRRLYVEDGAQPTAAELTTLGVSAPLPNELDRLVREADHLADLRLDKAERLALHAQAERELRQQTDSNTGLVAARDACHEHLAAAQADWEALWRPARIEALAPEAMAAWLAQRDAALKALSREEDAAAALTLVAGRRATTVAALRRHVSGDGETAGPLLAVAETEWARMDQAHQTIRETERARRHAQSELAKAAVALNEAAQQLADWGVQWPSLVQAVRLPPDTRPADADAALAEWDAIDMATRQWESERERVDDMDALVRTYAAETQALVGRLGGGLDSTAASVAALTTRLAAARQNRADHDRLTAEIGLLQANLGEHRTRRDDAAGELAVLCRLAGVGDEIDLAGAIARAQRHAALIATIAKCEASLRREADGADPAKLIAAAEGQDADAARARLDEIEVELDEVQARIQHTGSALALATAELDRMARGNDAAEAAQRMEDAAHDAQGVAARYASLRLAADLLQAGLARFREEQQAPLLRRAGEHFSALTQGRYVRLEEVDADGGKRAVSAIRDTGHRCPVHALSEGTLDQLYLALRLAAIESHAAKTDPFPFIADDLLVHFDDARAMAGLRALAELGRTTQTILFTHHRHLADMVTSEIGIVHHLPAP